MWHICEERIGELRTGVWWVNSKERCNLKDLGIDGIVFLKRIFNMCDGEAWTELIWLMIRTCGGLLWTR
jgi:hypothetical protein